MDLRLQETSSGDKSTNEYIQIKRNRRTNAIGNLQRRQLPVHYVKHPGMGPSLSMRQTLLISTVALSSSCSELLHEKLSSRKFFPWFIAAEFLVSCDPGRQYATSSIAVTLHWCGYPAFAISKRDRTMARPRSKVPENHKCIIQVLLLSPCMTYRGAMEEQWVQRLKSEKGYCMPLDPRQVTRVKGKIWCICMGACIESTDIQTWNVRNSAKCRESAPATPHAPISCTVTALHSSSVWALIIQRRFDALSWKAERTGTCCTGKLNIS